MQTVSHVSDVAQPELTRTERSVRARSLPPEGVRDKGAARRGEWITLTAYAVGREDAQNDEPFCPEMMFIKPQDLYDYAVGFLSIRPDCVAAEDMAKGYEDAQYQEAMIEMGKMPEPPYQPTPIDFDINF